MAPYWFSTVEKIERALRLAAVLALTCFVIIQPLVSQEPCHFYWKFADFLEGEQVQAGSTAPAVEKGILNIELDGQACPDRPVVKINGRVEADFTGQSLWMPVSDGDLITIDGRACDSAMTCTVTWVSREIAWPPLNYSVQTSASTASLGRVRIYQLRGDSSGRLRE